MSIILEHGNELRFFYLFNMHDFFNEVGRNKTLGVIASSLALAFSCMHGLLHNIQAY